MTPHPARRSALLVVDVQHDFCSGGTLAVPGSDAVIRALNAHIRAARAKQLPVYASRDWHPARTSHFKEYGGQWPVHCVQHSHGAEFHHDLQLPDDVVIVNKGEGADAHGYSAFEGATADGDTLSDHLRRLGITHLYVGGLATDYCVRASVLDALQAGFDVTVLDDAIAGVDLAPGDAARAREDMRGHGARGGVEL